MIDTLKRRARDMAMPFIDAAAQPNATELERAFGEAAQLILRDAETRAQQLPRDEFERRVEDFTRWHRGRDAELAQLSRHEQSKAKACRISEARRRTTVEFERREAEFYQWVEGFALAAWIRATEDLLTLDRPSAFICSHESPARH